MFTSTKKVINLQENLQVFSSCVFSGSVLKLKQQKTLVKNTSVGSCCKERVLGHTVVCRKEVIMIRKFVQCKNTKERLGLMAGSNIQDWAEGELDTVMEIFGMKVPEGASKQEKWELIMLSLTNKEAADSATLGSQKVFQDVRK